MTLADKDTNSIPTDNANRAIQGNVAIQVTQPGGQLCKLCKWRHLMTKSWTNPSCAKCATWWPNLQLMQVAPSSGQICNKCKWRHLVAKFATDASGAMLLPNLVQVTESTSGSVVFLIDNDISTLSLIYVNWRWLIWCMMLMLMLWPISVTPGVTHFGAYHRPPDVWDGFPYTPAFEIFNKQQHSLQITTTW